MAVFHEMSFCRCRIVVESFAVWLIMVEACVVEDYRTECCQGRPEGWKACYFSAADPWQQ